MMIRLVLGMLILTASASFGQDGPDYLQIKWGDEQISSKSSTMVDLVGYDESGFFVLKLSRKNRLFSRANDFILERYDREMKKTKTTLVDLTFQNKKVYLERIIQFNGRLLMFSSFNDQSRKKNQLILQEIDQNNLMPERERNVIADIDYKSKSNDGTFDVKLSRDSTQLIVWYDLPYKSGEPERYGMQVYDRNMTKVWERDIQLPYTDQLFNTTAYNIDEQGNVYVLGRLYNEKVKERRGGKPNYKYHLIGYYDRGSRSKEFVFGFEDRFITDMQIAVLDNGDIMGAGFYSDKSSSTIKGSFYLRLDREKRKLIANDFKDFDKEELSYFLKDKQVQKGKELFKYDLRDIILREDGGAFLIAEQFYIRANTYADPTGFVRTDYKYYYNDIGVVNISPAGKIQWIRRIPKKQISVNDGGFYSSYTWARHRDELFLIFNDDPRNLNNLDHQKVYNFQQGKNSTVVIVKIDKQGNLSKDRLFSTRESSIVTRPKVCEQVTGNEMVIYGQWRAVNRLARIRFN